MYRLRATLYPAESSVCTLDIEIWIAMDSRGERHPGFEAR
jgi:hypothetical protein